MRYNTIMRETNANANNPMASINRMLKIARDHGFDAYRVTRHAIIVRIPWTKRETDESGYVAVKCENVQDVMRAIGY